jgi:hypothetical protein
VIHDFIGEGIVAGGGRFEVNDPLGRVVGAENQPEAENGLAARAGQLGNHRITRVVEE